MRKRLHLYSWSVWLLFWMSSWGGFPNPGVGTVSSMLPFGDLACNDTINITLDADCQLLVTPDELLEGDRGCLEGADFEISIADARPENGPLLDGYGVFRYEIKRKDGAGCPDAAFASCWGYIRAEDKTGPEVDCPDDTDRLVRQTEVQRLAGTLTAEDLRVELPGLSCLTEEAVFEPGLHYYDRFRFEVTQKGVYLFDLQMPAGEPLAGIYHEEFDPAQPCYRLLKVAAPVTDGTGYFDENLPVYRIAVELLPGRPYVLFTSTRQAAFPADYLWAVYSRSGGRIKGLPATRQPVRLRLWCDNVDSVFNNLLSTEYLGRATATDNCSTPVRLGFTDRLLPAEPCAARVIERTFTFTDKVGNTGTCTQLITFPQPMLDDIVLPPRQAYVNCEDDVMLDARGNPHPMVTGRPFLPTAFGPLFFDEVRCGIGAAYVDEDVRKECGDSRLILRVWTLTDWCKGEEKRTFTQQILVGDFHGPEFDCPATGKDGALRFSTDAASCFAAIEVPLPRNVTDNCSESWTVEAQIIGEAGKTLVTLPPGTTDYRVRGIPPGRYVFRYIVTDDCGNATVRDCEFLVADAVAPTAVCNDRLHISVGGDGKGSTTATDVDEGSWDNCDPNPRLAIRRGVPEDCLDAYRAEIDTLLFLDSLTGRWYTPWREKLDFICCDVGRSVLIELRITDAGELSNYCWLEVVVEDKIAPTCLPPHDLEIPCDSLFFENRLDTLELQKYFGRAEADDNCTAVTQELPPQLALDNCGAGVLVRRFRAVDGSGNRSGICEQRITLTPRHNYEIKFPKDAENFSCGETEADTLETRVLACDLLAVSRDTTYFEAEADECYKMFIRYRVINWCEYKEGGSPVVVSRDADGDGKPGDEPVYVLRRPPSPDSTYIDSDNNERNGYFHTITSVGYWEYTQVLKVYDNTPPTIVTVPNGNYYCALNGCTATVDLFFDYDDNCTDREFGFELRYDENDDGDPLDLEINRFILGRFPKQRISGEFPIGKHSFYLIITDGCGNQAAERIPFVVVDCKPPAPVCIERLAAELMPLDTDGDGVIDGAANTIRATDFIASEATDCSGVRYSVNRFGETPHPDSASITVTCDDPDVLPVEVYAWDTVYNPEFVQPDGTIGGPNYSHCVVRVFVQDNRFNLCGRGGTATIAGLIATESFEPVEGAEVRLSGASSQTAATDVNGNFSFPGIQEGYDYTVVPVREDDPLNGISTFDLLKISKHILGVEQLDSPYKLIAADANRSGSVTTLDMIQLRKLILGTELRLPNNTNWRFLPADFDFPDPENPWQTPFPEIVNINDFTLNHPSVDFIAVKTGDVNGSAVVNSRTAALPRSTDGTLFLRAADISLRPGEEYALTLRSNDLAAVRGLQFALGWDTDELELVEVEEGVVGKDEVGIFSERGLLTISWVGLQSSVRSPQSAGRTRKASDFRLPTSDFTLLTLHLRARSFLRLRDALALRPQRLAGEAYDRAGGTLDVALEFNREEEAGAGFELYQNAPNPFGDQTVIGFRLPEAMSATIRVSDLQGRMLKAIRGDFAPGYNEIRLNSEELGAAGVLSYTLETAGFTATRKMIVIE